MKYLNIKVTKEDIKHGVWRDCYECSAALAIDRVLPPELMAQVGVCWIDIKKKDSFSTIVALPAPESVARFIARFDEGEKVLPFNFRLRLADKKYNQIFKENSK